jgi:putative ABC transport system permease protein
MIRNYIQITLRTARRNKLYTAINLFGLVLSLACSMLILIYLRYETCYDKYHDNAGSLFRVVQQSPGNYYMDTDMYVWTQGPFAGMLKESFPEVIRAARVEGDGWQISLSHEDKSFNENRFYFTDPDMLSMFSFPLIKGDPATALNEPFSLLVTQSAAERYFGGEDPYGKIVNYNNSHDFRITGVLEDVPSNSHFHFDFLASFSSLDQIVGGRSLQSWQGSNHATYIQTTPGADASSLEARIPEQVRNFHPKFSNRYILQPLAGIHLGGNIPGELAQNSHIKYIYIFGAVALFILVIGCFNAINLSTARAAVRAREVGVRKVVGAGRKDLIRQFLGESVVLALVAFALSLAAVHALVGWFGGLMGRDLTYNLFRNADLSLGFFGLALLVGISSGLYPAFLLSSFHPVKVLRGKPGGGTLKGSAFRRAFVVAQFVISTALIISSVVVFRQMEYIRTKDWGFDKEQVLIQRINRDNTYFLEHVGAFKAELLRHPGIANVSTSSFLPSDIRSGDMPTWEGKTTEKGVLFHNLRADSRFLDLYDIELLEGRMFRDDFPTDRESAYIVNETAVRVMGMDDPIGKEFGYNYRRGQIIGVVKDFHFVPLHLKIRPLAIHLAPGRIRYLSIKVRPKDFRETLSFIRASWKNFSPGFPFEVAFVDQEVNNKYLAEQQMSRTFTTFTFMAIFLACIGLFGLVSFLVERRTKEIGIRKVIGAPVSRILVLVTKDFVLWVLLANLIAWPAAYLAMHTWLQGFAYRIELGVGTFLLGTLLTLTIALLTMSYQSIRAASSDPVRALRYE